MDQVRRRPPAAAELDEWLSHRHQSRFRFCAEMRINPGMLWSWCSGRSKPSLAHAAHIERVTGIPATSWVADDNINNQPDTIG